jgi:hypothetical protein
LKQNNLLHEHLETVSAQATKLSNSTLDQAAGNDPGEQKVSQNDMNENMVESVEQLRGVIRYLRNNYDIAQQQIELSKMESARLQQQLQHASKALDQTKMELNHVWMNLFSIPVSFLGMHNSFFIHFLIRNAKKADRVMCLQLSTRNSLIKSTL